jgi:hypothetical protein
VAGEGDDLLEGRTVRPAGVVEALRRSCCRGQDGRRGGDERNGDGASHPIRAYYAAAVEELLAFGAALLALRLGGDLARRWRARRAPELAAWSAALLAYAVACAALAWGAAAGWDDRVFRVYYLFGGLLTAPLLGIGSLLLVGRRWAGPVGLVWVGLALGTAVSEPLTHSVAGGGIPAAQDHLALVPARVLAIAGNSLGTVAVVGVAVLTLRRRPLGNLLVLAGIAVGGTGSALVGLGEAGTAAFFAAAAVLLYAGFMSRSPRIRLTLRQIVRPTP